MTDSQVLIAGAGPTGLVLALSLAKAGLKPRIIDKNPGPGQASRAMGVQARTLEFYRQFGFADEVVSRGISIETINIRAHGRSVAEIEIGDFGEGLSPYPFVLSYPQDDHERLLVEQLKALGIEIEWETTLVDLPDGADDISVVLRHKDGTRDECRPEYLCGCDGAHSVVRQSLGLGFAGGTYEKEFFVADVQATGEAAADHSFSFCFWAHEFMLVLPVRSSGMQRLIGIIPEELNGRPEISFDDVRPFAEKTADIHVEKVNWFSRYKVHHRVADHFRVGQVFVAGDAGHIHSPVGAQGMNTGIGDAVNLAWKLAAVIQRRADASILNTYEPERIAFARSLVATTDRLFQLVTSSGTGHEVFRETIFPHLAAFALGFPGARTAAFRMVSQTRINYQGSALSEGESGDFHGGDRLPWVRLSRGGDNFDHLASLDWQAHVYGKAREPLRRSASDANLHLHEFEWADNAKQAGLARDALYLVRPDGYIGLADPDQDTQKLNDYLSEFEIVPR